MSFALAPPRTVVYFLSEKSRYRIFSLFGFSDVLVKKCYQPPDLCTTRVALLILVE